MKKIALLAICTLALVGCNSKIHGTMQVYEPFEAGIHNDDGMVVVPGTYETYVKFRPDSAVIELRDQWGEFHGVTIEDPELGVNRHFTGEFSLSGSQIDQLFDLKGAIHDRQVENVRYEDKRACVHHYETQLKCKMVDVPSKSCDGKINQGQDCPMQRQEICENEQVAIYGETAEIEKDYEIYKDFEVYVYQPGGKAPVGVFKGTHLFDRFDREFGRTPCTL